MRKRRGFTLIELMIVMLIMGIVATMAFDAVGNIEAGLRADRAAREAVAAIRYARSMAISTGNTYGVEFNTTTALFQVFYVSGTTNVVANQSMMSGGTYVVNMSSPELKGTTMTVSITGDTTNPYDLTFTTLGNTANNGTVVFTYAGRTRTVTIPKAGDPSIN